MTPKRLNIRERIADRLTGGALSMARENNAFNLATCKRLAADLHHTERALVEIAEAHPSNAQAREMIKTAKRGLRKQTERTDQ